MNKDVCQVLKPEEEACTSFSLIMLLKSKTCRYAVRKQLIEACVYPAILWVVPDSASVESKDFCERMLSIHCDGRYTEEDVRQLAKIINDNLNDND